MVVMNKNALSADLNYLYQFEPTNQDLRKVSRDFESTNEYEYKTFRLSAIYSRISSP